MFSLRAPAFRLFLALANLSLALRLNAAPPENLVEEIKQKAVPLKTVEPGSGFDDLQGLKPLIGDARVVALGECTHGSREIFKAKHRLLEFLVSELGFSLFAIEANMTEAHRLNAYVLGGEGDPAALVRGMGFWTWSTVEVRDMVEWMRRYNADPANRAAGRKVEFEGFDMQSYGEPSKALLAYLESRDPQLAALVVDALRETETDKPRETFGFANGFMNPAQLRGKHVVFSGWIRTDDLNGGHAGLWLKADTQAHAAAASQSLDTTGPSGTTAWRRYELVLDVPAEAAAVSFGVTMSGQGGAFFDDLQISAGGVPIDEGEAYDFGFDEGPLRGFPQVSQKNYEVRCVPMPHQGKRSLMIRSVDDRVRANAADALPLWKNVSDGLYRLPARDDADAEALAWVRRNAVVVMQALENKNGSKHRDASMAENVLWLLERVPGRKMVVWAHDGHVAKAEDAMGESLSKALGDKLRTLSFATARGEYRAHAKNKQGLRSLPLAEPAPDSVEAILAQAGMPLFVLDMRAPMTYPYSPLLWFSGRHPHRMIGSMEMEGQAQFQQRNLGREFDLVFWIERTSPSELLPAQAAK